MSNELSNLPKDLQGAANLLVHPLAGVAAVSALGVGLASQSFGIWMGIVAGSAETAQRLFAPVLGDAAGDLQSFADKKETPVKRAEARVKVIVDNARQVAKDLAESVSETASRVAQDTAGVVETAVATVAAVPAVVETLAELMPEDFRQPKSLDRPETPDDLKVISGVGPKLETVLNGLGVWTYGQIAAWSREEIAWLDDYLGFKGRIGRDDWIGQASKLFTGETKH